jgi:DHA1 family tetracycline resistance protein-like MFS transporter
MKNRKRDLSTLFFTIFLDMLGVGILIPVIPMLFAEPTSTHYLLAPETSERVGYLLLGILLALYSIGQFIAAPIIGQFSDKFGRKYLLAYGVFGTALGHALFAFALFVGNIPLLFVARFLAGVAGGNIVVAQAAIADITPPADRAKNFGMIGAAFGLGFIFGPFLGGLFADPSRVGWFSASTPFWFAATLSLVNGLFVIFFLRETHPSPRREQVIEWHRSLQNIARATRLTSLRSLLLTNLFFQVGFAFYTTFSALFLLSRFGLSEGQIGNYFAFVGLWIVFTQGFVTRVVAARYSELRVLRYSLVMAGVVLLLFLVVPNVSFLYFVAPFFSIAIGLTQANMVGAISRSASDEVQGEILGINGSVNAMAQSIPPLVSGVLVATFSPSAPILCAALLIIGAGIYFSVAERRVRQR